MTSEDIRIDAQLLTGFQIKDVTCFIWVKDAVNYIIRTYPLAAQKKTVELSVDKGDTYQIPEELVRLDGIYPKTSGFPYKEPMYTCDETGLITFRFKNDIKIVYRYVPPLPQTTSTAITLADKFCEPIKYYVAARQRARVYGQGDEEAIQYDNAFKNYIEEANISAVNTNKRHRRMPVARYY